jgi:ribA/ribD-fused uncharacterized protein
LITHFKDPEYKFLSNFYVTDVTYKGVVYPSSEHAYMSAKAEGIINIKGREYDWKKLCTTRTITCGQIKRASKELTLPANWNDIKIGVMYEVLCDKFSREPLRSMLLATGNENIQEGNWHHDKFWGVDLTSDPNEGENHLGRLLMKIRDEIRGVV